MQFSKSNQVPLAIDQGISSASNFVGALIAARILDPSSFGNYAVWIATTTFGVGLSRALVSERRIAAELPALTREQQTSDALVAALLFGGLCWFIFLAASIAGPAGSLLLAITSSSVVGQDLARYVLLGAQQVWRLVALDLAWAVLSVGALLSCSPRPLVGYSLLWGLPAGLVAAPVLYRQPRRRSIAIAWRSLRSGFSTTRFYVIEVLLASGSVLAMSLLASSVGGATSAGQFRLALTCLGPFSVGNIACSMLFYRLISEGNRSVEELARVARLSLVVLAIALASNLMSIPIIIKLALPSNEGVLIDTVTLAGVAIYLCGGALMTVYGSCLRASGLSEVGAMLRLRVLLPSLLGAVPTSIVAGVPVAVVLWGTGSLLCGLRYWARFRRFCQRNGEPS